MRNLVAGKRPFFTSEAANRVVAL